MTGPGPANHAPPPPMPAMHFIPHQIQRQLPTHRAPAQATFVPATVNAHQSHISQMGAGGQQINYTVTPMQVPSVVHNIPSTSGQTTSSKTKSKNHEKGIFFHLFFL